MAEITENNPHAHHTPEEHAQHESHFLRNLGIGTALITGAVILAPYVLPHLGFKAAEIGMVHGGLAGAIHSAIASVSGMLANGEWQGTLLTGVVGIGGVLLGNFLEKKQDGKDGINWGKVIRYAAITTTMIIAMPAVLTSISTGIAYLCAISGNAALIAAAPTFLAATIGGVHTAGMMAAGSGLGAMAVQHLITCGPAVLPSIAAYFLGGNKKEEQTKTSEVATTAPVKESPKGGKINIKIIASEPHSASKTSNLKIQLTDDLTGKPITPEQLETTHTEKLHLLISDQSLKDYHHIHPTPTGQAGVYEFPFTPNTSNAYHVWADFATVDHKHHNILTEIPASNGINIPHTPSYNSEAEKDGLKFKWEAKEPLQKGAGSLVEVTVTDAQGKVVDNLEPVLGAYAHMVGISGDGQSFIHVHPMGEEPKSPEARSVGKLQFHIHPEQAGATQFYLQVKQNGKDITVPFGQQVKQASLSDTITSSHQHHEHHAGMAM